MEITEFELFDIVYDDDWKKRKVTGIRLTGKDSGRVTGVDIQTNYQSERDAGSYNPVLLTPEILKLNGFELLDNGACGDGNYHNIEIDIEITPMYDRFDVYDQWGRRVRQIRYVHELQHIIRFLGRVDFANNMKM